MKLSGSALSNLESSYALFKSVSHNPRVAKVLVCFLCQCHLTFLIDLSPTAGFREARQESYCVD